jgi:hypothetical protein
MNSYPNRDNSRPTPLLDGTGAPVVVRGQSMPIRRYQVIVWVSVSVADFPWDPRTPAFPAILDTGNTFTLSIFQKQLIQWAGIQPPLLPNLGRIREGGQRYPCHEADAWLHPNVPGRRDRRSDRLPVRLQLQKGIAVYPDAASRPPHLPLLGLQALTANNLHLIIDGQRRLVSLRTPDWRTKLLRWLS